MPEEESDSSSQSNEEEEEGEETSEEDVLMQAFGETAVQGIKWLVSSIGMNLNQSNNSTNAVPNAPIDQQQQQATAQPTPPTKV